jgi:hypothetical protein
MEPQLLQYGLAGIMILALSYAVKELVAYIKQLVEERKTENAAYREMVLTVVEVVKQNTEAQKAQQSFSELMHKLEEVTGHVEKTSG